MPTARSGARLPTGPDRGRRRARSADPDDRASLPHGVEIRAQQVLGVVDLRTRDVGRLPGRWRECELHKYVCHLVGVDGLEPNAGWQRYEGQLRHRLDHEQNEAVVELGRAQIRPWQLRPGDDQRA